MPPLDDGMSFVTKDIAKAFFELDISSNRPPVSRKAPRTHNCNCRVDRPSPATNKVKGNKKLSLLTLPLEIRLQIYDELLVSRFDRDQCPSWAVGYTNQKKVIFHIPRAPQYRTMEPAVLRTCKQIYHEANSILYSRNVFSICEPEEMFRLILQIGWENFKLIKTMDIWVPYCADLSLHIHLLNILAEKASGLRYIDLGMGAELEGGWRSNRGLGDSLDFLRALGKIQGLEKLVIRGFYARNWPEYLNEKMGGRVQAISGLPCVPARLKRSESNEEFVRVENEETLQKFREYQRGTDDFLL